MDCSAVVHTLSNNPCNHQPNHQLGLCFRGPKTTQFHKKLSCHPKFHLPRFPNHSFSTQSSFSRIPITAYVRNQCFSTEKTNLFINSVRKCGVLVVLALLSMGKLGCKSALAGPDMESKTSTFSEVMEEKRETLEGKSGGGGGDEEGLYVKLLEMNPRDVEALKVVFYGKMREGRVGEGVKYVERLMEVQPEEVEWRLLRALCYEMMGDLSKAKRLFREILGERPLLVRALHGLALVMHKNKEGAAVFEMLDKALKLAQREKRVPEERNIRILIAQMHVIKGNLQKSLVGFQDLVNENPRDFRPYLCQGIVYSLLDRKKEAEEQFEIYRSLVPDEFPQRGFLDDVMLAAKSEPREQLEKQFEAEFSYRK
ncbi:hypothetical protein Sjap_018621 [Stephania japonica]|uniref:Chloroplast lumen common family protein n=1 Tax=Stephania japonica TaxID=461633 RepID=A0AAP0NNE5_9MAGN